MNAIDFCSQTFLSNFMDLIAMKVPHFPLVNKVYKALMPPQLPCGTSLGNVEALASKSARVYAFPFGNSEHHVPRQQFQPRLAARQNSHAGNPDTSMALSLDTVNMAECPGTHDWSHSRLYLQCRFCCLLKMQEILLEFIMGFPAYPSLQE